MFHNFNKITVNDIVIFSFRTWVAITVALLLLLSLFSFSFDQCAYVATIAALAATTSTVHTYICRYIVAASSKHFN